MTAVLHHFDAAGLIARGESLANAYSAADPFPHAVVDDFLPGDVATAAYEEFSTLDTSAWDLYEDAGNTIKLATSDEGQMGPVLRQLIAQFNGSAFIRFLESMTGITGLLPDPHLAGGGLHQLNRGGFLRVHADFNVHKPLRLDRRINALLYLNPDWQDAWGGALELWDKDMSRCPLKATPLLNRLVVFNTTSTSYHGNPDPVACPEGHARRSMALYYYTNGRPPEEQHEAHSTLYQTPGEKPGGDRGGILGRLRGR